MSRFEELSVGDVLTGHVTGVAPFGVFVRIADDADGLLYGEDEPQAGSSVTVRILEIDTVKRRASLVKV
jgi:predicted RNA-binding protein with RPS1 domain